MKIHFLNLFKGFFFLSLLATLTSCDFDDEVDLNLPRYENQFVVECYLEPGKPYRLMLTESVQYLENPNVPRVDNAKVTISYDGKDITLQNQNFYDPASRKSYNYISDHIIPFNFESEFFLNIETSNGKKLTAKTKLLEPVSILRTDWKFNSDSLAYVTLEFNNHQSYESFYRVMFNRDSIFGTNYTDFTLTDDFASNGRIAVATGNHFSVNETVVASVFHITRDYFRFLESIEKAARSNRNPFAQPSTIASNIDGGTGIFTGLSIDRKEIIIKAKNYF
jgi:hypothetical protein